MKSLNAFFWAGTVGLAVAMGCATGNPPADETNGFVEAGAGEAGACADCTSDQVCADNMCESKDTDADKDGYPVTTDCDDHDPTVNPGAKEVCDDKDDNCDGKIDEGFDVDGDGYFLCTHGARAVDCDDTNPDIHPNATEVCNDKDDNCDSMVDEGFDKDGDTFFECAHGLLAKDCDDNDKTVYPGAMEVCDGKDNDCNGKVDDIPAHPVLNDPLQNPHWLAKGNASISAGVSATLTPNLMSQAGVVWWDTKSDLYLFDHFEATANIVVKNGPGADGVGFIWVPDYGLPDAGAPEGGVGNTGADYGFAPLGGYGVIIDTYTNPGEPTAPFIALVNGTNATHITRSTVAFTLTQPMSLDVKLENFIASADGGTAPLDGVLTVMINGVTVLDHYVIPGYVPFKGKWGFAAATGGISEEHDVTTISMSFPDGQGCVQ